MAHTAVSIDTWMNDTSERRRANPDLKRIALGPLAIVGIVAVVGALLLARSQDQLPRFWHAYLIAATYCATLSLGGLFFVIIQYLAAARWGVVLRRLGEIIAMGIGVCGVFFAVIWFAQILAGSDSLYPWANETVRAGLAEPKQIWLNPMFFIGRQVFYFVVWYGLANMFYRRSVEQDRSTNNDVVAPLLWHSGWSLLVFALTINFATMDWLMTLNPTWFSTIFGVYIFAGSAVGIFALLSVLIWRLQARGILTHSITEEHRHDIGKLLFGFVLFWGYISFSQFLLIWYAYIPEEIQWYSVRQFEPTNTGISRALGWLFVLHFIIPFLGIMSRFVRRNKLLLAGWGVYMLVMHYFDLYFIIAPESDLAFWPLSLSAIAIYAGAMLGLGALYAAALVYIASGNWLIPVRDPRLEASLEFENI
jgi:hypothetical protein